MKQARLGKIVEKGMKKLVDMGMSEDYEVRITETGDFFVERQNVEIIIDPFERHLNNSYLAFAYDHSKRLIDNVRAGWRKGLEKDFAEPSIYILGDIGKTLGCEWMRTNQKHVAKYGPWVEYQKGLWRINVELFTLFK